MVNSHAVIIRTHWLSIPTPFRFTGYMGYLHNPSTYQFLLDAMPAVLLGAIQIDPCGIIYILLY